MLCGLAVLNLKEGLNNNNLPPLRCISCVVCANARRVIITVYRDNRNAMLAWWAIQRQF